MNPGLGCGRLGRTLVGGRQSCGFLAFVEPSTGALSD